MTAAALVAPCVAYTAYVIPIISRTLAVSRRRSVTRALHRNTDKYLQIIDVGI